jgi:predicted dinucleotide-binding enzyme
MLFTSVGDAPAEQEVTKLIDHLGFAAIDLGDFEMGSRF